MENSQSTPPSSSTSTPRIIAASAIFKDDEFVGPPKNIPRHIQLKQQVPIASDQPSARFNLRLSPARAAKTNRPAAPQTTQDGSVIYTPPHPVAIPEPLTIHTSQLIASSHTRKWANKRISTVRQIQGSAPQQLFPGGASNLNNETQDHLLACNRNYSRPQPMTAELNPPRLSQDLLASLPQLVNQQLPTPLPTDNNPQPVNIVLRNSLSGPRPRFGEPATFPNPIGRLGYPMPCQTNNSAQLRPAHSSGGMSSIQIPQKSSALQHHPNIIQSNVCRVPTAASGPNHALLPPSTGNHPRPVSQSAFNEYLRLITNSAGLDPSQTNQILNHLMQLDPRQPAVLPLAQGIMNNPPNFPSFVPAQLDPTMDLTKRPPPPPRAPPRPSEDEMAAQDRDVDAQNDEEFQEVETYAEYVPTKLKIGKPHPDPVVETNSLSTVEPPDITYKLRLPSRVIDEGRLSALQLESVIYACQQHEQFLADKTTRRGFLIGDGAGVGKGRTIAGIIYENYTCGRKKALWISVSPDLSHDAQRDLRDIGATKIPIHTLKDCAKYGKRISASEGVMFVTYSGLVSQSHSDKGPLYNRLGQLTNWLGKNFDGVIVFDECHKAKNVSTSKTSKANSKAAENALKLQRDLPNARLVYASATGASETRHLGYMIRLGIWGEGTPYSTFQDFCDIIEKRGVSAMELVAVDLKQRGAYIARQLSFKTTNFEIKVALLDDEFIKLYDECAVMWAKALANFEQALALMDNNKKAKSIYSAFWSAHQRFFKYLCIGIKVPVIIDIAHQALNEGKCVVIGLQSTGEARTNEANEQEAITDFISTARATFESLVDKYFPCPNQGRRRRVRDTPTPSISERSTSNATPSSSDSGSGSSTVDDAWHNHTNINFLLEDGEVKARIKAGASSTGGCMTRNRKSLISNSNEPNKSNISDRTMRAKRRAKETKGRNSRVVRPEDSESSENSTLPDDDSDYSEDGDSSTIVGSEEDEDEIVGPPRAKRRNNKVLSSDELDEDDDDDDVVITAVKPRSKHYEVVILSDDEDECTNPNGLEEEDPIIKNGPRLNALRNELYEIIDRVGPRLPNNTLDDLINRLGGPTKVAEMTGRKGRIVKDDDGVISFRNRNEEDRQADLNVREKERFMQGKKLIAIISEAASSGISLQADRRVANTRRRVHITIELPWSADKAIQQFGRTHRSNQLSGPQYVFVISELSGEKRFASIVAKRLESLGALTHGDRRATMESRDLSQFNIASKYSRDALQYLYRYLESGNSMGNIRPDYEGDFLNDARAAMTSVGLGKLSGNFFAIDPQPGSQQVNTFLNRILGMRFRIQNAIFAMFSQFMDRLILRNKVSGKHDAGILELNTDSGKTKCYEPENYKLKTPTGIANCTLRVVTVDRGISWEEAVARLDESNHDSRNGFYLSLGSAKSVQLLIRELDAVDLFRSYKPNIGRGFKPEYFTELSSKAKKVNPGRAESIWKKVYDKSETICIHLCYFDTCKRRLGGLECRVGLRLRKYAIISGAILTAWPYLEAKSPGLTSRLQVVRLKIDAQNRVIGPLVPEDKMDTVRRILAEGEKSMAFKN